MLTIKEFYQKLDLMYGHGAGQEINDFLDLAIKEHRPCSDEYNKVFLAAVNELGAFYKGISRLPEAVEAFETAGDIIVRFIGENSVEYGINRNNIAGTVRLMGQFDRALELFSQAADIYENVAGKDQYYYATVLNNMSLIYLDMKDEAAAEEKLLESLSIVKELPDRKEEEAITLINLAAISKGSSRLDQREHYINEAMKIYAQLSDKGVHYAAALNMQGSICYSKGEFKKAEQAFIEARDEIAKSFGENDEYMTACENLKMVWDKLSEEGISNHMKGLELSRKYFEAYGQPMLNTCFPDHLGRIAVGLVGEGSECLGFDDDLSRDHDWGPAFCVWLTDEDYDMIGERMQQEYQKLQKEFSGFQERKESEGGQGRVGVLRISDFYMKYLGLKREPLSYSEWLRIPENFLSVATNGEVFADPLGEFSRIRAALLKYYPEDVRLKKIAGRAAIMFQSGQYNFSRCIKRKEIVASQSALTEFVNACCAMVYLLNKKYIPFYKWAHHGIQFLPLLSGIHQLLRQLYTDMDHQRQKELIEVICKLVIDELKNQGISENGSSLLLDHCPEIMGKISDDALRQRHVMSD